jgi:hypothetical protein
MIDISKISIFNKGIKDAVKLNVRGINYTPNNGKATADVQLLDENGEEVAYTIVDLTPEQCAAWTDDVPFMKIIAQNASLTPVEK